MSDLIQKRKISVNTGGGLHNRMAQSDLIKEIEPSANPKILPNRIALMLDCSGSMHGEKIKLLTEAAQDFITKADMANTSIALESFPPKLHMNLQNNKEILWMSVMGLEASGGTPMDSSIKIVIEYPITRGIIISDGEPDYPASCIELAKKLKSKEIIIDTVHIGDSSSGEELLRNIAEITGGLYVKFTDILSFSKAFHFLLPEHRAEAARLLLTAGANEVI